MIPIKFNQWAFKAEYLYCNLMVIAVLEIDCGSMHRQNTPKGLLFSCVNKYVQTHINIKITLLVGGWRWVQIILHGSGLPNLVLQCTSSLTSASWSTGQLRKHVADSQNIVILEILCVMVILDFMHIYVAFYSTIPHRIPFSIQYLLLYKGKEK